MVNINDISQYKKCQKKKYNVWVCMPQVGTCVINKLEQAQVVAKLNGKTHFTLTEMNEMRKNGKQDVCDFLSKNAYIVSEQKRFVLSGTQGELWTIDANKLAKTYTFADGTPITEETLKSKMKTDKAIGTMDWQMLESKGSDGYINFAMHVPMPNTFQIQTSWGSVLTGNDLALGHGKGDFIVCAVNPDGSPNINDRWIVNGIIFGDTYDNRGWSDKIASTNINGNNNVVEKPKYTLIDNNYNMNVSHASTVIPELTKLITHGGINKQLEQFAGKPMVVKEEKDSKGRISQVYLDFNFDTRDFDKGKVVPKPNFREARITLSKRFNSAFVILKTWNARGDLHDQYGHKIRLGDDALTSYTELEALVTNGLNTIKIPKEADGRSSKDKAKDMLNLFGRK